MTEKPVNSTPKRRSRAEVGRLVEECLQTGLTLKAFCRQHNLDRSKQLLQQANYAYAAFFAEQAAQQALEAYLISRGRRYVMIHSVGELAREAMSLDPEFERLVEYGRRLDRHYLTSRYPDAPPDPIIPAEAYGREDAEQAVSDAQAVLHHVLRRIGGDPPSRVS